jgi:hypothetical protein
MIRRADATMRAWLDAGLGCWCGAPLSGVASLAPLYDPAMARIKA